MRLRYAFLAAVVVAAAACNSGCQKLQARDSLNKGVQAFKAANYSQAVELFKKAVDLDPSLPSARLYLAVAYYSQYIPGADSPENLRYAESAMDQFNKVLQLDPKNVTAASSIASLYYNEKKFDQAAEWNHKVIQMDPNNKEAYYTLGVLAWTQWLPVDRQARLDAGMKAEDPPPIKNAKVRDPLKEKWMPILDEGVKDEEKALQIDPEYDDAMAYMNLLIRYRADLLDTSEDAKKASDDADKWMTKSLETKKVKAERKAAAAANGATTK